MWLNFYEPPCICFKGYDVWMGNTRGNTYSRNHVSFDPCSSCPDFWNFGFDDSGVKDYSAEIDYILDVNSNYEKLHFVGHSMGCTQFVVSKQFYIAGVARCIRNSKLWVQSIFSYKVQIF